MFIIGVRLVLVISVFSQFITIISYGSQLVLITGVGQCISYYQSHQLIREVGYFYQCYYLRQLILQLLVDLFFSVCYWSQLIISYLSSQINWADCGNVTVIALHTKVLLSRPFGFSVRFSWSRLHSATLSCATPLRLRQASCPLRGSDPFVVDGLHC